MKGIQSSEAILLGMGDLSRITDAVRAGALAGISGKPMQSAGGSGITRVQAVC